MPLDIEIVSLSVNVPERATYITHALVSGHIPGVLSGAELSGKARNYGAQYARSRVTAYRLASRAGVKATLTLINVGTDSNPINRWCVVWTRDGNPVRLVVERHVSANA